MAIQEWQYRGKKIENIPEGIIGFTYCITTDPDSPDRKYYWGKKQVLFSKKIKISKKEKKLYSTKKRIKRVFSESDWRTYTGSSKELNEWIWNNPDKLVSREILQFHKSKIDLTYREIELLIIHSVLFRDDCWNLCIGNRFWKGKISKL